MRYHDGGMTTQTKRLFAHVPDEQPYEIGWCMTHDDLARKWGNGSWSCWWQSTVRVLGHHEVGSHEADDFRPLLEVVRPQ